MCGGCRPTGRLGFVGLRTVRASARETGAPTPAAPRARGTNDAAGADALTVAQRCCASAVVACPCCRSFEAAHVDAVSDCFPIEGADHHSVNANAGNPGHHADRLRACFGRAYAAARLLGFAHVGPRRGVTAAQRGFRSGRACLPAPSVASRRCATTITKQLLQRSARVSTAFACGPISDQGTLALPDSARAIVPPLFQTPATNAGSQDIFPPRFREL